jgi:hypothetical protein
VARRMIHYPRKSAHKAQPNNINQRKQVELAAKLTGMIQNLPFVFAPENSKRHDGRKGEHVGFVSKCCTTVWHVLQFLLSINPAKGPSPTSNWSLIRPFDQLVIASEMISHPEHRVGSISVNVKSRDCDCARLIRLYLANT